MQIIDADTIHQSITYPELTDGLLRLHREGPGTLEDMLLNESDSGGSGNLILIRAAFQPGKAIGVKMAAIFPDNKELPSVNAAFVLFDGSNGLPVCLLDGTALTYRKTAADSALGSQLLSREDSHSFLMVGAGAMSTHLVRAHLSVRPNLKSVKIWNRTAERARDVACQLGLEGIETEVAQDLDAAVAVSDIICCATMTRQPLIQGRLLKPGAHLDLVGAYQPDMREADDECMRRGRLYVDSRKTTVGVIGEISEPMEKGIITDDSVLADFYDLSDPGFSLNRESTDITVFKNGGGGHLDLMTARLIMDRSAAEA